jgi:hypothetical protein
MASLQLRLARARFEAKIAECQEYVRRCQIARHQTAERSALSAKQIEWAVETGTLKLVVASERFFETSMALYALGHHAPNGYRPRRLRRLDCSVPEMCEIFMGDQNFVGWNDPSTIIQRAEGWFKNGEPYQTNLSGTSRLVSYLKKMRNAIAHESATAYETYSRETRNLYGALPRRVQPGAQLLGPPPAAIPYLTATTLFESVLACYRSLAAGIAPS